jgi:hypothetical protein
VYDERNSVADDARNQSPPPVNAQPTVEASVKPDIDDHIRDAVKELMKFISEDEVPYILPKEATGEIRREIEMFREFTALAGAIEKLKRREREIKSEARIEGAPPESIDVNIAIYSALAETSGGQTGDPVESAQRTLPDLQGLRISFGSETADASLILVAAYKVKNKSGRWHPLLNARYRKPTDRNVWYLHQEGILDREAYDFVLRFLAFGAVAQDPRRFGVAADPLRF